MDNSGLLVEVPKPMVGLITKQILVMSRLRGFKISDTLGLQLHSIDSNALMVQVCHCFAYLILVAGVFNGIRLIHRSHCNTSQLIPTLVMYFVWRAPVICGGKTGVLDCLIGVQP